MAYSEAEVAEIARFITDKPYTWREEDGRLMITTRDGEYELMETTAAEEAAEGSEPAPLEEAELERMTKTALLALAAKRGVKATRRWTPVEIRRALLAAESGEG